MLGTMIPNWAKKKSKISWANYWQTFYFHPIQTSLQVDTILYMRREL